MEGLTESDWGVFLFLGIAVLFAVAMTVFTAILMRSGRKKLGCEYCAEAAREGKKACGVCGRDLVRVKSVGES